VYSGFGGTTTGGGGGGGPGGGGGGGGGGGSGSKSNANNFLRGGYLANTNGVVELLVRIIQSTLLIGADDPIDNLPWLLYVESDINRH
jgi:hypothetical protein